ncbi:Methyl methanesulfonate-sensitivity 22 protein [Rutstroemia sp. NJR-2017a BBW]|nr:Methyl methanesulfonate-sensitivity 22 protein [Rutstroemia sp. NJR-2017a BBW]
MARNWKEIGIVPDSDEEDDLNSQNTIESIRQFIDENNELHDLNHEFDKQDETEVRQGHADLREQEEVRAEDLSRASSVDLLGSPSFAEKVVEKDDSAQNVEHTFDAGLLGQEEDERPLDEANGNSVNPASQSGAHLVEQDEVSRSWVRATSPASSILSSPPSTQLTITSNSPVNIRVAESIPSSRVERAHAPSPQLSTPSYLESVRPPAEFYTPELPRRRNLRERRPEQIHPFLIEQMKYEKRMKDSHLKPVKFIQAEDRPNLQEQDSQDTEFHDVDADYGNTQDSQAMNLDRSSPPVSASPAIDDEIHRTDNIEINNAGHDGNSDSDQELPDLPDLFRNSHVGMISKSKSKSKSSKRVYTNKNRINLPKPSTLQTQQRGPEVNVREPNIFDFPGSSPTSSPPIRSANARRPVARVLSNSSNISTSPWLDQSSPTFQMVPEALTPATSTKTPGGTSPINLVSDDEDSVPPVTDQALSSVSESSDDEEIAMLRRLKKKIKHVLPASHLRLDQRDTRAREQKLQGGDVREPEDVRAGVARPTIRRQTLSSAQNDSTSRMLFIESDESDDNSNKNQSIELYDPFETSPLLPGSNLGYAVEDDRIDHMLPTISRKRKAKGSLHQPKTKRQILSTSSHGNGGRHLDQPRITAHLAVTSDFSNAHATGTLKRRRPRKAPPKLSILDYTDTTGLTGADAPQFLKVASRTARSRKALGRQSPTHKFVRLATREDTADAQAVLSDWRTSKIQPRAIAMAEKGWEGTNRYPLGLISGNRQTDSMLSAPKTIARSNSRVGMASTAARRKIRVSRTGQRSLGNFVTIGEEATHAAPPPMRTTAISSEVRRKSKNHKAPPARLAQLETSEIEYTRQFPSESFKSTMKSLDSLYRRWRRRPVPQSNLQMSRFLADDDVLQPPPEDIPMEEDNSISIPVPTVIDTEKQRRRRKRSPRRVDAGAAVYRQPSEPPIMSFFAKDNSSVTDQGKLFNLGKFGTRYPRHFDILPLLPGVHFHETTFIASGHLADAVTDPELLHIDCPRSISLNIGDEEFTWRNWDERVSEQMGIFIDWVSDQLNVTPPADPTMCRSDLVEAATHLVSYVQHSSDFVKSDLEVDYLLRMSDILRDFSSRFDPGRTPYSTTYSKQTIQVLTRFSVLVLRLLRISRGVQHSASSTFETILRRIAESCIRLLVSHGLDEVRKLYDDLQYLSVRDNGIRNDKYFLESWVVIYHVLGAAKISGASFWDLTNIQLGIEILSTVHDASKMENMWFSVFTLLPLSAFNMYGVVAPNQHEKLSTDNWPLIQALLKRVFELYRGNIHQPPGFNNYCRAIIGRCHYLVQEWGWQNCTEIVKTIFDFFSSMKLSNLRHEDVYKSPQFLEQLDKDPSLDLEPEERCFHIFLKLVAIAIKHMQASGDTKNIRNLVARISPNHDRQYPKEEEIHQDDLASLRNHHDLLCTLYWSAPYRLGPSVGLLQNLVSAESSHNAAFLINLRAWTNLARYVLSRSPADFRIDAYEPFLAWQNCFSTSLLDYYLQVETIARSQVESLPQCSKDLSENRIQSTIDTNRMSTVYSIQAVARGMIEAMKSSNSTTLRHAINFGESSSAYKLNILIPLADVVAKILSSGSLKDKIGQELVSCAIDIFAYYLRRLRMIESTLTAQPTSEMEAEEFDSQGFGIDHGFEDTVKEMQFVEDFLHPINQKREVTSVVCSIVREALYSTTPPDGIINHAFTERLSSESFLISGTEAVFNDRADSTTALVAWPLFVNEMVEHNKTVLEMPGFDLGLEWIVAISKPEKLLRWENVLTCQLLKQNHFLVSVEGLDHDEMVTKMLNRQPSAVINQQLLTGKELNPKLMPSLTLIGAIKKIQKMYSDKALLSSIFPSTPAASIRAKFSNYLEAVMTSMQHQLRYLQNTDISAHKSYVLYVQKIVSQIHSHSRDICRLPDFFFQRSAAYWPPVNDPKLYLAGITGYSLELSANLESTRNRLFYYLWNGLVNSLSEPNTLNTYITWMTKAGSQHDFLQFLLTEMLPSALEVAFRERAGWLICDVYLVAVCRCLTKLFDGNQAVERVTTYTTTLLQQMLNGLNILYGRYGYGIEAVHPNHQGIITVICRFWRACRPHLINYNISFGPSMDGVLQAFDDFAEAGMACFGNGLDINLRFKWFDLGNVGNDVAVKAMTLEVQKNWSIVMVGGKERVLVRLNDGKLAYHGYERGPQTLIEVLEGALAVDVVGRSSLPFF